MVYQSGSRKRVWAIRRGPDGSAFEKCERCGGSVAIALADMHECEPKRNFKKFKSHCERENEKRQNYEDQPRSAFRFFMEEFMKNYDQDENEVDIDRKGFETWNNMLAKERHPYILQAEKINSVYNAVLLKEENDFDSSWVDDEADSAEVGKCNEDYDGYDLCVVSDNSGSYTVFWSEASESLDSKLRARMRRRLDERSS